MAATVGQYAIAFQPLLVPSPQTPAIDAVQLKYRAGNAPPTTYQMTKPPAANGVWTQTNVPLSGKETGTYWFEYRRGTTRKQLSLSAPKRLAPTCFFCCFQR